MDTFITEFSKVYENTLSMLSDRKYTIDKDETVLKTKKLTQLEIDEYMNKTGGLLQTKDQNNITVAVFFSFDKFGINELKSLLIKLTEKKITHLILVLKYKLTSHSQKLLLITKKMEKEIFYFNEMTYNPTKHILVPKHEIMKKAEYDEFVKNIGKKIPCIKLTDRMCRHLNGKLDQIIKIYRSDGSMYYRIVIK